MIDTTASDALISKLKTLLSTAQPDFEIPIRAGNLVDIINTATFWRDNFIMLQTAVEAVGATKQ
jgi:uncharacterized protein YxjI